MPKSPALITPLVPLDNALPDDFADMVGNGPSARPADTLFNSIIALKKLELDCSYNIFRNEYLVSGRLLSVNDVGELSDLTCIALRQLIRVNFMFEPSKANIQDAVQRFCAMRTFHPIKDYLNSVPRWDGIPRVDTLLPEYFNAPDTPFNRAVSRIVMMASVRRILKPGTKFDYMTVLQSPEGFNKSSAIAALYGADYFTDQSTIGLNARDTEEVLRGHWAQENAELSGIGKVEWGKLKANLSRTNDRTRRVYERNPINAQRTCIQWATSNDDAYLRALTGENRRFFSVDVLKSIDLAKIISDRDDLWAEAVELEATGESVMLAEAFWADARVEREKRTEHDPWEGALRNVSKRGAHEARTGAAKTGQRSPCYEVSADNEERISNGFLFHVLGFEEKEQTPALGTRVAGVMKKLGWEYRNSIRIGGETTRGYKRALFADLM
jgi:Virulence-associated protein E